MISKSPIVLMIKIDSFSYNLKFLLVLDNLAILLVKYLFDLTSKVITIHESYFRKC